MSGVVCVLPVLQAIHYDSDGNGGPYRFRSAMFLLTICDSPPASTASVGTAPSCCMASIVHAVGMPEIGPGLLFPRAEKASNCAQHSYMNTLCPAMHACRLW